MNLLLVHEANIWTDSQKKHYCTDGAYNMDVLKRYLDSCDCLRLVLRKDKAERNEDQKHRFALLEDEKLSISLVDANTKSILDYLNIKKRMRRRAILSKSVLDSDAVIARLPSSAGKIAAHYAKKHAKPCMIEVVGCPQNALWNHSLKGKLLAPFSFVSMRGTVRKASHVVYVTDHFLQKRYPCKGNAISCSNVVLKEMRPKETFAHRNAHIKQRKEELVIGTTAAVDVPYKGHRYVIEALAKCKEKGRPLFSYQLVGRGDPSALKKLALKLGVADRVSFLGPMAHDDVLQWLDAVDVYIQPSLQEGLPRALIEAMSKGCLCIGLNTGGIPELLPADWVIPKRKDIAAQICDRLLSIREEDMLSQARRNIQKATAYDATVLYNRRQAFYQQFIHSFPKDRNVLIDGISESAAEGARL